MTNFELHSFADSDELARVAARSWLNEIEAANRAGKSHCVALSGGRITQKLFAAVVEQNQSRKISFVHARFFWADERCVPPTHPDSNFKMADELLFRPLKIAPENIHRLRGELPSAEAVRLANDEVRRFASSENVYLPKLDLVLLGMGEDGHVASLFPNAGPDVLKEQGTYLAVSDSPKPPPNRVSLSYAAIGNAQQVWVLVSGAGKEFALKESLKPDGTIPLARVIQSRITTKIFSDLPGDFCKEK